MSRRSRGVARERVGLVFKKLVRMGGVAVI